MQDIIINVMNNFGYLGIALLIAVENIFPPIPSEVILTFGGFMTTYSSMSIIGVVVAATIGSLIGATALYLIGRILTPERLEYLLDRRLGRLLCLKKEDVNKAEKWFSKRGKPTVFFCRFVPIVRSLISIPAGMTKMEFVPFILLTAIGSAIWNIVLVYLGWVAGSSWTNIAGYMEKYSKFALIGIIIIFIICTVVFYKKRLGKNNKK